MGRILSHFLLGVLSVLVHEKGVKREAHFCFRQLTQACWALEGGGANGLWFDPPSSIPLGRKKHAMI